MDDSEWQSSESLFRDAERALLQDSEHAYLDRARAFQEELNQRFADHVKVAADFDAGLATEEEYNESFMSVHRIATAYARDPYRRKMIRDGVIKAYEWPLVATQEVDAV